MYKLSYGLFVLTAREDEKDNGCIINTAIQAASEPVSYTHLDVYKRQATRLSKLFHMICSISHMTSEKRVAINLSLIHI